MVIDFVDVVDSYFSQRLPVKHLVPQENPRHMLKIIMMFSVPVFNPSRHQYLKVYH